MKKRFGFVSNSSSSSFVAFATKEVFDDALAECTEIQRKAVEENISHKTIPLFGKEMKEFSYYYCSEEFDDDICDLVDEYFPDRNGDNSEIYKLTEFVYEGGFEKLLNNKAAEHNEAVLSYGDYR